MRIGKWEFCQVTVFVEDLGTEIREERGSFQRLVSEMKHIWMEESEAELAFWNHSEGTRKDPEAKTLIFSSEQIERMPKWKGILKYLADHEWCKFSYRKPTLPSFQVLCVCARGWGEKRREGGLCASSGVGTRNSRTPSGCIPKGQSSDFFVLSFRA